MLVVYDIYLQYIPVWYTRHFYPRFFTVFKCTVILQIVLSHRSYQCIARILPSPSCPLTSLNSTCPPGRAGRQKGFISNIPNGAAIATTPFSKGVRQWWLIEQIQKSTPKRTTLPFRGRLRSAMSPANAPTTSKPCWPTQRAHKLPPPTEATRLCGRLLCTTFRTSHYLNVSPLDTAGSERQLDVTCS